MKHECRSGHPACSHAEKKTAGSPVRQAAPFLCSLPALAPGTRVTLSPRPESLPGSHAIPSACALAYGPLAPLAVGTCLQLGEGEEQGHPLLRIIGRFTVPSAHTHAVPCFLAEALCDHPAGEYRLVPCRDRVTLAWITLSDKGAAGLREDESGPRISQTLAGVFAPLFSQGFIIPDNPDALRALAADLALHQGYDLVVTTGGTGLGPRDTTPEALIPLLRHRLPGFEQTMMAASLAKTPHAAISRAIAGTMGQSLVLALPGSKKAVRENLEAVAPALAHALAKLQGDPADCG